VKFRRLNAASQAARITLTIAIASAVVVVSERLGALYGTLIFAYTAIVVVLGLIAGIFHSDTPHASASEHTRGS